MYFALLYLICWFLFTELAESQNITSLSNTTFTGNHLARQGCPSQCGNVTVPYPFGIGIWSNCSLNSWFAVDCDTSVNPPYLLIPTLHDYRVIDISESNIRIRNPFFSSLCYSSNNNNGSQTSLSTNLSLDFSTTPYSLSEANRLTLIGCSDLTILEGDSRQYPTPNLTESNFASGCVSLCSDGNQSRNGSCPGNGCCQIPVPKGTVALNATISDLHDRLGNGGVKPCSYSFLGERDSFAFGAVADLYVSPFSVGNWVQTVPVILDWRIGNISCEVAARDSSSYACQENSDCIDAEAGVGGYRCRCVEGYMGNPYLPQGCLDINECTSDNPCYWICINTPGSYRCSCPSGYYGDGRVDGAGCLAIPQPKLSKLAIGLISGTSLIALLSLALVLTKFVKKKKNQHRRQKFFKQNGGLLIEQETSTNEGILRKTRIFTAKELDKATDYFNESRILGQGGQGTVYKGMLSDGQIVAIKKSKSVEENKSKHLVQQFINEVVIMSQINHRNVVKLLGCCLETRVPLLVYEFMSNGTLSNLIHDKSIEFPVSWAMRLKIAADVAGALAYLHSATSIPIFHRDVKSSNILLDVKFISKVSDFGTSKSVEVDQTHLTTMVNGTFGYIDPEYFQSSQFTDKSDVYSFGVVLVELLTGLKPIMASTNTEGDKSLVSHFLSKVEGNNLELILDSQVSREGEKKELMAVAELAKRCLHLNGKLRPTMKEVAMELEGVRKSQMGSDDNTTHLAGDHTLPRAIFSVENSDYSWTNTSDFGTVSTSDLYPMMHDTI